MVNVIETVYKNGRVLADNANIPENSKVLVIWDTTGYISNSNFVEKTSLPSGIDLNKIQRQLNPLESFPIDAVEFQRSLRDGDWN